MSKKIGVWLLTTVLLTTSHLAEAQQPEKVAQIGYLAGAGSSPNQAFVQGMRDLGYVEGKNIAFVYRTAEGKSERNADLAVELVRLKVDIIVADGTGPSLAAKKATSTIPIVMTTSGDPVGTGLVAEPCSARGKRHGVDKRLRRAGWQNVGAAQGDRAETQSRGYSKAPGSSE